MMRPSGESDRQKPWRIELCLVGARRHLADVEEELRHLTDEADNAGLIVESAVIEPMALDDVVAGSLLAEALDA